MLLERCQREVCLQRCDLLSVPPPPPVPPLQTRPHRPGVFISYFGLGGSGLLSDVLQDAAAVSTPLFLIVFRENQRDMSVGVVNITQRKYYKDALHLHHHFQALCQRRVYPAHSQKEKWLLGNKVNKRD